MKKLIKKFHSQSIILQIELLLVVLFLFAMWLNAYIMDKNQLKTYLNDMEGIYTNLSSYVADEMLEDPCLEWLLPYWKEHCDELDITYDDTDALAEKYSEFDAFNTGYNIDNYDDIQISDVESMTAEEQKVFAEYRYMKMTDMYSMLKKTFEPTFLYCFYPEDSHSLYIYLAGALDGEVRQQDGGSLFQLGTLYSYDIGNYPVLSRTMSTKSTQNELEHPDKKGDLSNYYHVFVPVVKDGKVLCVVSVTVYSGEVKKGISETLRKVTAIEAVLFMLIGLYVFFTVKRIVLKPVLRLGKSMQKYNENNDPEQVKNELIEYESDNEVGRLTKEFTDLTFAIKQHVEEKEKLFETEQKFQTELDFAKNIQTDMLPKEYPKIPKITMFGSMEAAKSVGGDFYDFFFIDETHLALAIGDVSGKGVPASLFMVKSMMAIRNYAMLNLPANEVLSKANNELCRGNESDLFTTAWFGIYDIETGKVSFAEAGHDEPLLVHKSGNVECIKPSQKGVVLGYFEDYEYGINELTLGEGDLLFMYTDGLPEANDIDAQLYGMDRLIDSATHNAKFHMANASEFVRSIRNDVSKYVGKAEQFDDLTMLAIKKESL